MSKQTTTDKQIETLLAEITGAPVQTAQESREVVFTADGERVQATIDQASAYCRPRTEPKRTVKMLSLLGDE